MATIKEVAKLASVSITTVSRVLSHDPSIRVTPQTRARIEEAAHTLGYTPRHIHAQAQPQRIFGLVKGHAEENNLSNTHMYALSRALERALSDQGHGKYVFPIENLPATTLDGVIALGKYSTSQIEQLERISKNLLFIHTNPDATRFDSVCLDTYGMAESCLGYLHSLGHRRIAYVGASEIVGGMLADDLYVDAVCQTLKAKNCFTSQWIRLGDYSPTSAYEHTHSLLSKGKNTPTAILYATDAMAIGGYRAIRDLNLQVGADVSIVAVDDLPTSSYITPPLTTFYVDVDFISWAAVRRLEERLCGHRIKTYTTLIPLSMTVRNSACKVKE